MLQARIKYLADAAVREEFNHVRQAALKSLVDIDQRWRCMGYYHETRPDGLYRTVDKIGEKIKESFVDRDDLLEYHSMKLDRNLRGTEASRSLPSLPIDSLGDISMTKISQKYRAPDYWVDDQTCRITELCSKIVFYLPKKSIRITYHRPEGRLMGQQLTFHKTPDGLSLTLDKLSRLGLGEDIQLPTPKQLLQLLQLEKTSKHNFVESMNRITTELALRRKEENNVKNVRLVAQQESAPVAQNAMGVSGGPVIPDFAAPPVDVGKGGGSGLSTAKRNLVLVKDVYDYARNQSMEVLQGHDGSDEREEEEGTGKGEKKVDILAPYLAEFPGKQLDALRQNLLRRNVKVTSVRGC
ncbi:hypothetical protein FOZ60_015874 [Perkinsus olseni]|uniref:Dynein regulatory complex subunit 7 MORN domain-containing protein n=1 Tax=Perkinsus olseni TaxID=32597 RepID=A0A7J6N626_PEROL|nr:hypothetical protein FOZ60_015874 [Perkinsus olseni]